MQTNERWDEVEFIKVEIIKPIIYTLLLTRKRTYLAF